MSPLIRAATSGDIRRAALQFSTCLKCRAPRTRCARRFAIAPAAGFPDGNATPIARGTPVPSARIPRSAKARLTSQLTVNVVSSMSFSSKRPARDFLAGARMRSLQLDQRADIDPVLARLGELKTVLPFECRPAAAAVGRSARIRRRARSTSTTSDRNPARACSAIADARRYRDRRNIVLCTRAPTRPAPRAVNRWCPVRRRAPARRGTGWRTPILPTRRHVIRIMLISSMASGEESAASVRRRDDSVRRNGKRRRPSGAI